MKKLLLAFIFLGGALAVSAQSASAGPHSDTLAGSTTDLTLTNHFDIMNVGTGNVFLHVLRKEISLIPGSKNNFCWGPLCYPDFIGESTTSVFLTTSSTDTTFKAQYSSLGNPGLSTIRYCFYDSLNTSDSMCFNLYFKTTVPPVGIGTVADKELTLSNAYPNPANSMVSFQYQIDAPGNTYLVIRNVLGAEVARRVLRQTNGTVVLPTSNMENGIYLYSLETSGDSVMTRRLVVAH